MTVRSGVLWMTAIQYLSYVLQFATSVIIARHYIGPEALGVFSVGIAFTMLLSVIQDFGLYRYITTRSTLEPEDIARFNAVALMGGLVISSTIAAAAYSISTAYHMPDLLPVVIILAASNFATSFVTVPQALIARAMQHLKTGLLQLAAVFIQAIGSLYLAAQGHSVMALAWATLLSSLARAAFAHLLCPTKTTGLRFDGLRPILHYGGHNTLFTLCSALGGRMPDLIIGKMLGFASVGLFSRAMSLTEQVRTLVAGSVGSVLLPAFATLYHRGQPLGPAYLRLCSAYSAVVWPTLAGLALASAPLIRILFGPAWAGVAPILSIIAVAEMALISLPMVSELSFLTGHVSSLIKRNALDNAVSLALIAIGCFWGIEGAALSRLIYAVAWRTYYGSFMQRVVMFDHRALLTLYSRSLVATGAAILPLSITYMFGASPDDISLLALLGAVVLGIIAWIATLFAIGHPFATELQNTVRGFLPARRFPA